jgi:hypothetical protein
MLGKQSKVLHDNNVLCNLLLSVIMSKQTLFTLLLPLLMVYSGYGQLRVTNLLEMPLLKTEKETLAFLQKASGSINHQMVMDGTYRSYSLEGPSFHIEYKIFKDTCVMSGIRFSSFGMYNSILGEVVSQTKPFGENRLRETRGTKLIYMFNPRDNAMTVVSYSFALQKVNGRF